MRHSLDVFKSRFERAEETEFEGKPIGVIQSKEQRGKKTGNKWTEPPQEHG